MLIALLVAQVLTLVAVAILMVRRPPAVEVDQRLAHLPEMLIRHEARLEGLEGGFRAGLADLNKALRADLAVHRGEAASHAQGVREAQTDAARQLRDEVTRSVRGSGNKLGSRAG